jgi:hypothetical protein
VTNGFNDEPNSFGLALAILAFAVKNAGFILGA